MAAVMLVGHGIFGVTITRVIAVLLDLIRKVHSKQWRSDNANPENHDM